MVTAQLLARSRRMFIIFESPSAFLEDFGAIGKNSLAIMQERTVSIQAPLFLAEILHRICEHT
jgi:hypothetical protein